MLNNGKRTIVIGFFFVLAGAALPFLIIIGLLESTYLLNFIAFMASMTGTILGVIGTAMYVGERRNKDKWDEWRNR